MVIWPRFTPKASWRTFTTGARQLVVHEAFETMWCSAGLYVPSLTPRTTVRSGSFAGAEITTFFAPASRCFAAPGRSVNLPVDSTAYSTPSAFQGSSAGSFAASTRIGLPLMTSESAPASTVPAKRPWTESYLSRCARVLVSVRSLIAATSNSGLPASARKNTRPMRPKPLMPMRIAMALSPPMMVIDRLDNRRNLAETGEIVNAARSA